MKKEFLEIIKGVVSDVENVDSLIDSYFDPIKDFTDTAKDIFTPIKIVHSLYTLNKKRKFKSFLKSYAKGISDGNIVNPQLVEDLKAYIENQKNFNFINDLIESAINSRSIYGAMLLGYFAGEILKERKDITFKELIIMEGIRELNDFEFSYFAKIYSIANLAKEVNIKEYEGLGSLFLYEVTIKKLIQLRIVDEPLNTHDPNRKGRFISNDIAEDIYMMIQSIGIKDDLLTYSY